MTAEPLTITTPSDREVAMARRFDAPRVLVFEALTTPELLRRWYGPEGWELVVCDIDLGVGGAWRFVGRTSDGREVGQYGRYLEIEPPERIVQTERWEDWDPGETHVTTTLTEVGDTTLYSTTMRFHSRRFATSSCAPGSRRAPARATRSSPPCSLTEWAAGGRHARRQHHDIDDRPAGHDPDPRPGRSDRACLGCVDHVRAGQALVGPGRLHRTARRDGRPRRRRVPRLHAGTGRVRRPGPLQHLDVQRGGPARAAGVRRGLQRR